MGMISFFIDIIQKMRYGMIILDVNKINKTYGFGKLLNDISFSINEGERVAIVGNNGSGKSTLLKIIAKIEKADSGVVSIKKDAVVEYLEQGDVSDSRDGICIDILKSAFGKILDIEKSLQELEQEMCLATDEVMLNKYVNRYSNLQEKFLSLGGYDIHMEIDKVVNGLKIDKALLTRGFNSLSGGERTLINMARILLSKPDLLLLDEPTNHLDINRLEWLESYIKGYKGSVVIVSHDRYFLDKVVNKIIEIDNGNIKIYHGNYTDYVLSKENEEVRQFEIYKVQEKKFQEMEKAIKKLKEWGKMGNNPTFFRRAKAIQSNLDRQRQNAVEKPNEARFLPINFVSADRGSQEIVCIKNLHLVVGEKLLLNNANCLISNGEKVALLGDNGTGKSTLIKAILSGNYPEIKLGNQKIGYLSQIIEFLDKNQSVLQYFIENTGINEEIARSKLFNFQFFKSDIVKRVGSLSGGEKLRLKLAIMLQQDINLLILDEPTNHIDIETREVLEQSLTKFKGSIIFVSHDRYFINKLANKIIEIKNQNLYTFVGDYDDYLLNREKIYKK
ncbi:MAG: ABC-F family ATP-binding cassette domain-containing protein [Clostridiales bacterium]|nr:ABC-F family ATP-binding cassette domain-containing protein [Clostridiales bacterium]